MIRVEAKKGSTLAKFDERDRQEAFRRAAHLLDAGFPTVKLWLRGNRNVPLEVDQYSFAEMRRAHG